MAIDLPLTIMSCTSSFVDDVALSHNGANTDTDLMHAT